MSECGVCKSVIMINDDPVACVRCGARFHRRCTNLTKAAAKLITDNQNILFKCDACLSGQECIFRGDTCSHVLNADEMKKISSISDAITDMREHITVYIDKAIESGIARVNKYVEVILNNKLTAIEGSVAKIIENTKVNLNEINDRGSKSAVMNRKRNYFERTTHSESDLNSSRKKKILTDKNDKPIQIDIVNNDTIDDVFHDNDRMTYSNVLTGASKLNKKTGLHNNRKTGPVIVIKPVKVSQTNDDTRKDLKNKLDPKIHNIRNFRNGKEGSVIVECVSSGDIDDVKSNIESGLGENYIAVIPTIPKPKVKIVGMSDEFSSDVLIELLKSQNENIIFNDIKVVTVLKNPRFKYNKFSVVLEVDVDTFKRLMKEKHVNVGWDRCPVVESVYVLRCFKCGEFGHKAKECKKDETCSKCCENHKTSDCSSNYFKCVNCLKTNSERKMNLDVEHPAYSVECPVYQKLLVNRKYNEQAK